MRSIFRSDYINDKVYANHQHNAYNSVMPLWA